MRLYKCFVWLVMLIFPVHACAERERQSLETFESASLVVAAVYFDKCTRQLYAAIRDPGGYIHLAYKRDYLGKNFGRIVEISRKKGVRALEAVQDQQGEWVEREIWIPFERR